MPKKNIYDTSNESIQLCLAFAIYNTKELLLIVRHYTRIFELATNKNITPTPSVIFFKVQK